MGVRDVTFATRSKRRARWLAAFLLLAQGCSSGGPSGLPTTTVATSVGTEPSSTSPPPTQTTVRAYFLRSEKVGPVARQAAGQAVAAGALAGLLAGPNAAEQRIGFSTAIPSGTTLRGVTIKDGVAAADLSAEFASGGGSASMQARVAQVVFTLTQFPTVHAVTFSIDGKPVTVLGGEGLMLDTPQRRTDWEALAPAILVESPLPFSDVSSPVRIVGTANTFEAVFRVNVTDGQGLIVYDQPAKATSGTGTRGTFDVTATFKAARTGSGAIVVFENSPRDGRQVNVVDVPVNISA